MSFPLVTVASRLVQEELISLFSYPIWWYSTGISNLTSWMVEGLRYRWRKYALGLWLRHLTLPMYGEYSFIGRAVSFCMRVVVVVGRGIAWVVEAIVYGVFLILWLVWPVLATLGLILSGAGLLARGLV